MTARYPLVLNAGKTQQIQSGDSLKLPNLTSGRIPFATTNGELTDDAGFTCDGTTVTVEKLAVNTSGQGSWLSTRYGTNSAGNNIWIGNGGGSSIGDISDVTLGSSNVSIGVDSLFHVTTGKYNLAIGTNSLHATTDGSQNVAMGVGALSLADGDNNVALGFSSLANSTSGYNNIAVGFQAMLLESTGHDCVAIGYQALYTTTGSYSVAIGSTALFRSTTGSANTAIGNGALFSVTDSSNNTSVGNGAGYSVSTGSGCVFLGRTAGFYETGSDKLFIDTDPRASEADARLKALVYGVFAANAVDQDFTVNGQVGVNIPPTAWITVPAGTATAGTAPMKLTSGVSTTVSVAGQVEFTTDDLFFTITTGAVRCGIITNNGANLTSGKIPIASTNGRLIDGQTPLAGTKVYYVADSSGGTVNRKLTFIDGILTSET